MRAVVLIELWVLCCILYQIIGQNWEPSVKRMNMEITSSGTGPPPFSGILLLVGSTGTTTPASLATQNPLVVSLWARQRRPVVPNALSNLLYRRTGRTEAETSTEDVIQYSADICNSLGPSRPSAVATANMSFQETRSVPWEMFFRLLHFLLFSSKTVSIPWCAVPEEAI
jgi:hypothetical protein